MEISDHIYKATTTQEIQAFVDFGYHQMQQTKYGSLNNSVSEHALFDPEKNHILKRGGRVHLFIYKVDKEVLGRIAVFFDPEIHPLAYIGLFDSVNDTKVSTSLFDAAITLISKQSCTQVIGPLNGSIFDSYRIMTHGFKERPFIGEPRNPEYYEHLFIDYGFNQCNTWETLELKGKFISNPFSKHQKNFENFHKLGYSIKQFKEFEDLEMIKLSYQLISKSYSVFPYYSTISESDFMQHSKHMPALIDKECSLFLFDPENQMVGVIIILRDLFFTVKKYQGASWFKKLGYIFDSKEGRTLNMIQGASLPQYIKKAYVQGIREFNEPLSLTTAALYQSFEYALQSKKYDSAMNTLMREGAEIKQYFKNISTPTRKYCLFEFKL